jgi:hypothetical protein
MAKGKNKLNPATLSNKELLTKVKNITGKNKVKILNEITKRGLTIEA